MSRKTEREVVNLAMSRLVSKRVFCVEDQRVEIAVVVRTEDVRPLRASWWRGKDCSIIAVDVNGNFCLRMSGGEVLYRDHQADSETRVADSVRAFFESFE